MDKATVLTQPRRKRRVILAIVSVLTLSFLAGVTGAWVGLWLNDNVGQRSSLSQQSSLKNDGNKIVTEQEQNISSIASKVGPSVVSIVTQTDGGRSFYDTEGAGTGIIVSGDGYVMTNHHVISETSKATVVLADGTSYDDVKIIGSDPLNDIAFLKINGVKDLPAVALGDSSTVHIGQQVVAIGNSLGQYQNTVTSGILSGTGRPVSAQNGDSVETLTDLLQTDAAINPGNSGGPLLNIAGQVIGINTAVAQDAQGIGFAIPINSTKGVLKGVLAGSGIERAYIGFNYIPITADVAKQYKLSVKQGAYAYAEGGKSSVVDGSPAQKAGLKDKDIITKVNDQAIGDAGGLSSLIGKYAPGETIELTILRGDKMMTLRVTLATYRS